MATVLNNIQFCHANIRRMHGAPNKGPNQPKTNFKFKFFLSKCDLQGIAIFNVFIVVAAVVGSIICMLHANNVLITCYAYIRWPAFSPSAFLLLLLLLPMHIFWQFIIPVEPAYIQQCQMNLIDSFGKSLRISYLMCRRSLLFQLHDSLTMLGRNLLRIPIALE